MRHEYFLTFGQRTFNVKRIITVRLVSSLTNLDSVALPTVCKKSIFQFGYPIQSNWRPAIQHIFLWFERQPRFIVLLDIKTLHITVSLSFEPLALKFSFSDLQATHFALSYFRFLTRPKNSKWWQWVVARLAEQLLSNPEARGSNPVISKQNIRLLPTILKRQK